MKDRKRYVKDKKICGSCKRPQIKDENMFAVLMEVTKYCSLGQLTAAMFEGGGQCRRNM